MLVSLRLLESIKMAGITVTTADNLLVRIESTDGHVGWGEAASAPTMTGEMPGGMLAAIRFMQPRLEGLDVEDLNATADQIDRFMYANEGPKSAIDMALHDLEGKRQNIPVTQILGGAQRSRIPVLWLLAANDAAADVTAARRKADEGFVAFKVKVGIATVEKDLERCAAVRQALGKGPRISADANQGFSRVQAIEFARGAFQAGLDFIEQPVDGRDLEGMAAVASASPVAVGADEGVHRLEDVERHHTMRAASGASLKTIKLGGLSAVMKAGQRMDALGMSVNLAGKMADSSLASTAISHLAAALPQLDWDLSPTCQYLRDDIATEPLRIDRGHVHCSDRPGLGIDIDEAAVTRFRLRTQD